MFTAFTNALVSVVTQFALSLVMLMGAERAGLLWHLSDAVCGDILHLWAVVGSLMGVPGALLDAPRSGSLRRCQAMLESLFVSFVDPNPYSRELGLAGLRACAWRAPFPMSPSDLVAVTHVMAGPRLAALSLPAFDDPALQEDIYEDNPSVSFSTEMSHVRTHNMDKVVDASDKLHRLPCNQWIGARSAAFLLWLVAGLMRIVSGMFAVLTRLQWAHPEGAAAERGQSLLAIHRGWPIAMRILPHWILHKLAEGSRGVMTRHVSRRLGYRMW